MENEFLIDSKVFLKRAASLISSSIKDENAIVATLFFALGIERFLKGLLFEINHSFVLKVDDFSNSFQCFHSNKIIKGQERSEVFKKSDEDVVNFRISIMRCKTFSPSILKHANMLFTLNDYRDIIAHCRLSLLPKENLKKILQRDFYQLLSDILSERSVNISSFLGRRHILLAKLSSSLAEKLKDRMEILISAHKNEWEKRKNSKKDIRQAERITTSFLEGKDRIHVSCPACENSAIIQTDTEYIYDPWDRKNVPFSVSIINFKCHFCGLLLEDYDELDFFEMYEHLFSPGHFYHDDF